MDRQASPRFEKLLEPITCGRISMRNRIVMPPIGTRIPNEDGSVNERLKAYYAARAHGGVGTIIVECSEVDEAGKSALNHVRIDRDDYIPGLTELARVIHDGGARAVLQLLHGGRMAMREFAGVGPAGPSPIPGLGREVPRELTTDDIARLVVMFGEAAGRAKAAGFDGVEIHGAHHYLISQFLSGWSNKRQDEYGGSVEKRARFALEVIRAVRSTVGPEYPVWFRFNAREYGVDGVTLEDALVTAKLVEDASVDLLDVSAFGYNHTEMLRAGPLIPGMLAPLAEAVKRAANVPVIAVGRIGPELGERLLREGKADLIAMGRALLADPELPNKLARGAVEEIRPCLGCMECSAAIGRNQPIHCTVNQYLCREAEPALAAAVRSKKVLVVGGGPAGMETARIAALRGHCVTLMEKEQTPGGLLRIAGNPPYKGDMVALANYLQNQARRAGVDVRLGCEATPATIATLQPDTVVIAAGARPTLPAIEGLTQLPAVIANDVLSGASKTGQCVVVIGGEQVGCETAEYLVDQGKTVTVTRRGPTMATKVTKTIRDALVLRLAQKGVRLLCGVQYRRVTPQGLIIANNEGKEELLPADTLVIAAGAAPKADLAAALAGGRQQIHLVGDCREPRGIIDAFADALAVGQSI